jgi:hypothetical protein
MSHTEDPRGAPAGAPGLSPEELEAAQATELPEREALSIVTGGMPSGAASIPLVGAQADTLVGVPEDPT